MEILEIPEMCFLVLWSWNYNFIKYIFLIGTGFLSFIFFVGFLVFPCNFM